MTAAPHVAKWAAEQAPRERDAFFDLAIAVIEDGLADEASAPKVVAECAKHDYDLSLHFARQVILVAERWGEERLTERRATFNSFRPVHTLVAQIGTKPGEKPTGGDDVPVQPDGCIDTEAVYETLAATGKPITHRAVLRAVGKANFDDKKAEPIIDSADVFTVAATMPVDALADRIATDADFRDALIDLVVLGIPPRAEPSPVSAVTATATAPLDALARLKKAEAIVVELDAVASTDSAVADILRSNRATFQAAVDLFNLNLDGFPAAT